MVTGWIMVKEKTTNCGSCRVPDNYEESSIVDYEFCKIIVSVQESHRSIEQFFKMFKVFQFTAGHH